MSMTIQQAIENRERCLKYLEGCAVGTNPDSVEAVRLSLEALLKRNPTMVTHEASIYACHTCPSCKNVVDEFTEFIPGQKINVQQQWCKYCGQALKWEE